MGLSSDAVSGLLGVVTGSVLTGGFQLAGAIRSERREERRERRAALRLIRSELANAQFLMEEKTFTDAGTWRLLGPLIREESWQRYQDGLARDKDVNYRAIAAAYGAVEIILRHAREEPPSLGLIEEARHSIGPAIKHLDEPADLGL